VDIPINEKGWEHKVVFEIYHGSEKPKSEKSHVQLEKSTSKAQLKDRKSLILEKIEEVVKPKLKVIEPQTIGLILSYFFN
jgi:hypothetical protein